MNVINLVDDDEDDNLTLAELVRRDNAKKQTVAAAAAAAAAGSDDDDDLTLAELVRRDNAKKQDKKVEQTFDSDSDDDNLTIAQLLRRENEKDRQQRLKRTQYEQQQEAAKRIRMELQREATEQEEARKQKARLEQIQRQQAEEALEAERVRQAAEAALAAESAAAFPAEVAAARYREVRRRLLHGTGAVEPDVKELRQLRAAMVAHDRSPQRSPTIGQNFPITAEEHAYLGQFPVWGPYVKRASPRLKYELLMRKKEREHEFLKRTVALDKTRPRMKSAVVLITMHGAFYPDRRTIVPPGMVVTRGSLSSPGALRFGDQRTCPEVNAQWEYRIIRKGLQAYKELFPGDPDMLNPADFLNLIEAEMNVRCMDVFVPLIEKQQKMGTNAFCSEHVGLQYMMYQAGQPMAFKMFTRTQSQNEHEFNIYVIDMSGRTTKLLPDRPLKQSITSTEILEQLQRLGFTNVILLDMSCQSFLFTAKEKQREVAARFGQEFLLGGF